MKVLRGMRVGFSVKNKTERIPEMFFHEVFFGSSRGSEALLAMESIFRPRWVRYLITSDNGLHRQMVVDKFVVDAAAGECRQRRVAQVLRRRHVIARHGRERWRCRVGVVAEVRVPRLQRQN